MCLEDILLKVEKGQKISAPDINFLALNATQGPNEAVKSIRALGCIGEEGLASRAHIRPILLMLLRQDYPSVRIAVVHAFWQMTDWEALPELIQAEGREIHPAVRDTIKHVIRVLGNPH